MGSPLDSRWPIIRKPGLAAPGKISAATVETIDIIPTLADLEGISAPDSLDGMSLRPFLENPAAASAKPATARGSHGDVRNDRWRLIVRRDGTRPELFDYDTDPGETTNHAAANPEVVESLMKLIK